MQEASNLAKFQQEDGIVSVKNFFYENNTAYMVMEYIDGDTLKEYLAQHGEKLPYEIVLSMMRPVMKSLTVVHEAGIIHRDISPDNIMVTKDGKMKLIDFGAARFIGNEDEKSLTVMLKEGYAPPEQYQTNGKQGPWTDVYALCATMYRMLSGIVPVEAPARVMNGNIISSIQGVSVRVNNAIAKGMALETSSRYDTISDLLYTLEKKKLNLNYLLIVLLCFSLVLIGSIFISQCVKNNSSKELIFEISEFPEITESTNVKDLKETAQEKTSVNIELDNLRIFEKYYSEELYTDKPHSIYFADFDNDGVDEMVYIYCLFEDEYDETLCTSYNVDVYQMAGEKVTNIFADKINTNFRAVPISYDEYANRPNTSIEGIYVPFYDEDRFVKREKTSDTSYKYYLGFNSEGAFLEKDDWDESVSTIVSMKDNEMVLRDEIVEYQVPNNGILLFETTWSPQNTIKNNFEDKNIEKNSTISKYLKSICVKSDYTFYDYDYKDLDFDGKEELVAFKENCDDADTSFVWYTDGTKIIGEAKEYLSGYIMDIGLQQENLMLNVNYLQYGNYGRRVQIIDKKILENMYDYSNNSIIDFIFDDYDGDGNIEAFGINQSSEGKLKIYFANEKGVEMVSESPAWGMEGIAEINTLQFGKIKQCSVTLFDFDGILYSDMYGYENDKSIGQLNKNSFGYYYCTNDVTYCQLVAGNETFIKRDGTFGGVGGVSYITKKSYPIYFIDNKYIEGGSVQITKDDIINGYSNASNVLEVIENELQKYLFDRYKDIRVNRIEIDNILYGYDERVFINYSVYCDGIESNIDDFIGIHMCATLKESDDLLILNSVESGTQLTHGIDYEVVYPEFERRINLN